jgi:hypothetical protein
MKRPVLVTTEFKGVFFGYAEDTSGDPITLEDARCAIYWGTTKGVWELAATGPTPNSKIGATVPKLELRKITAVSDVTPEAEAAWKRV